jgi:alpha-L-rhamnosidase
MFISGPRPASPGDPALYFRRDFAATPGLRRAVLRVTALGVVEAYLNGHRVGDEVLAPGWTSYHHRLMVRTHDVSGLIMPGANTLGAIVGEGWAVGPLGWGNQRGRYADRPALLLRLELEYDDRTDVTETDERFRVGTGAVRANGIYAGEQFDARLDDDGWARPGFDDSGWERARTFDWDPGTLREAVAEPVRRVAELAPVDIRRMGPDRSIVDFGQNISGWVRLTVNGERGRTVTLRHAELLTLDGELETGSNRSAAATDRYTLRGGGPETWEPRFTFHGFRYAEVSGPFDELRAVVVHSDMRRTGWFESSDALVNRLHANAVWSMRGNFVGLPTDCPQRDERFGWTGDINAFAPTATFLYDVRKVLGSWLEDLAADQRAAGVVPWTVPDVFPMPVPHTPTALWGDAAVSVPWELYQEYAEPDVLLTCYPSMTAHLRQVEKHLDADGLWTIGDQFGDWHDPDAPPTDPAAGKADRHLVASAFLCKTAREMARAAHLLGRDAAPFTRLADRARAAFRREYVTAAGRVAGESATGYALAIMFDILDSEQRRKAGDRLAALVSNAGHTIPTGFAGTPLLLDALTVTGHLDDAYALLLQRKAPSFLYPVTMGATTCWERWEAVLPDGTLDRTLISSLNHYAFGAVADWLHRVVGGLVRTGPGWRTMRVAPQPGGGITSASAVHETVRGRAAVAWRIADGAMTVDVTVPEGSTATVVLPSTRRTVTVGPGTHAWHYPWKATAERLADPRHRAA